MKRQWCGAVGKKENCIVTVHLTYARYGFHTLIDGELYLPKSWSDYRARCQEAGIPDDMVYRPKWKIGLELYDRAIGNGLHFDWMTFDEGYGSKPELLRRFRPATSDSWVKCRAISGAGSKHRESSREPSANTAAGAGARRPDWPVVVRYLDGSMRCAIRMGSATSPGSSGGSRTGTRAQWRRDRQDDLSDERNASLGEAAAKGVILDPRDAPLGEAIVPATEHGAVDTRFHRDILVLPAISSKKDDPGPLSQSGLSAAATGPPLQRRLLRRCV